MGYTRPTPAQITAQIENDLYVRLGGTSRAVRFSVVKIIARVMAGAIHLVYGFLAWAFLQVIPDTAESEYLERWALIWGIQRKSPEYATGLLIFSGNDGIKIPAFTTVQTNDNFIFQTLLDATISSGVAIVQIQALVACEAGNIAGNTKLFLVSPLAGVQSFATLDAQGTSSGSDSETDDALRDRLLSRIRNAPCAGNKKDYETWCLQIQGNTRAWCYPQYQGNGNVGLMFTRDNDKNIVPNSTQMQDVFNTITALMPVTANLNIFAPTILTVDFIIKVTVVSDELKDEITNALKLLFFNVGCPIHDDLKEPQSGVMYLSDILETIATLKSIQRFNLLLPTADIQLKNNVTVAQVGCVTLQSFSL